MMEGMKWIGESRWHELSDGKANANHRCQLAYQSSPT